MQALLNKEFSTNAPTSFLSQRDLSSNQLEELPSTLFDYAVQLEHL